MSKKERLGDGKTRDQESHREESDGNLFVQRITAIREQTVVVHKTELTLKTTPDEEQQHLLHVLSIKLYGPSSLPADCVVLSNYLTLSS
ncbi:MAG: hypothetical protein KAV82_07750 [Phycisphaerae bacterium]|nr:hypothetical protein [Phycisphaerae bacterium]